MKLLRPFLALYRLHTGRLALGIFLAIVALLASIALLTLSGWFLAACSLAGAAGLYGFNYMLPAAGVRGAAILRTAARYGERLVSHDGTFRILEHLRVFTFDKLIPLSPGGLSHLRQGDLLQRLVADIDTLDHLYLRLISPLLGALAAILAVTLGLGWLNGSLALTLGAIMLLSLLLLPPLFYYLGKSGGEALVHWRSLYRDRLTTWLRGQAELKIYGAEPRFYAVLDETEQQWLRVQRSRASLNGLSQAVLMTVTGITTVLMLWLSADSQAGAVIALFLFCTLAAFEALAPVGSAFLHLGEVMASARRVSSLILQQPTVVFPSTKTNTAGVCLSLRNVSFGYTAGKAALQNISLEVAQGEHVALSGCTGCGKSTLLQLLTRAWDPSEGMILMNGRALKEWDEASLRKATSVVTQRVHLFNGTLRDNLLIAAADSSDRQLASVLDRVGLQTLLAHKQGLNAWLGEGGRQLSGGELRRLGLARALLHNGPLLLLDEPTEGLDSQTERQILALIRQAAQGKTLIMVTHRLQDLAHFDKICVMEGGQIIEQGNHVELISKRSRYCSFCQQIAL